MTNILEVHLDLDGLFADFDGGVKAITGKTPKQLGDKRRMWSAIHSNKFFFIGLEVIDGSMELWKAIKETVPDDRIKFLTGAPSSKAFQDQKREWVAKIFGAHYEVNVVARRDKQKWSGPCKVLIDDTEGNIHDWFVKGGHGILHDTSYDATIRAFLDYNEALSS